MLEYKFKRSMLCGYELIIENCKDCMQKVENMRIYRKAFLEKYQEEIEKLILKERFDNVKKDPDTLLTADRYFKMVDDSNSASLYMWGYSLNEKSLKKILSVEGELSYDFENINIAIELLKERGEYSTKALKNLINANFLVGKKIKLKDISPYIVDDHNLIWTIDKDLRISLYAKDGNDLYEIKTLCLDIIRSNIPLFIVKDLLSKVVDKEVVDTINSIYNVVYIGYYINNRDTLPASKIKENIETMKKSIKILEKRIVAEDDFDRFSKRIDLIPFLSEKAIKILEIIANNLEKEDIKKEIRSDGPFSSMYQALYAISQILEYSEQNLEEIAAMIESVVFKLPNRKQYYLEEGYIAYGKESYLNKYLKTIASVRDIEKPKELEIINPYVKKRTRELEIKIEMYPREIRKKQLENLEEYNQRIKNSNLTQEVYIDIDGLNLKYLYSPTKGYMTTGQKYRTDKKAARTMLLKEVNNDPKKIETLVKNAERAHIEGLLRKIN